MSQSPSSTVAPPLVALVAWLLPGMGYWLIGQRTRGATIGITILLLFLLGLLIGGVRVVDLPELGAGGTLFGRILQNPWFIGQVLAGPITLVSGWIGASYDLPTSTARVAEIGTLYTAIAGMLNLLAIIDSSHRAGRSGRGRG